jgi:lipopolysaccharide/colanic/teichoic acid biosynthesis glycosyltransferase
MLVGSGILGLIAQFARRRYLEFKRALDVFLCLAGLALTLPLMGVLALLVKLTSPGPALYRQQRVGKDGQLFEIIKLRTMRQDAEAQTGPVWAKKRDSRVTPLGAFLRASHLDELPQLFNVLRGDMSIVGPRPERPHFVEQFRGTIPHYARRLTVKPGITGLAQVRHKYDESLEDVKTKLAYDILYIRKMCWMVDFRIMLGTARKMLLEPIASLKA